MINKSMLKNAMVIVMKIEGMIETPTTKIVPVAVK